MIYQVKEEMAITAIAEMIFKQPDVFKTPEAEVIRYLYQGVKDEDSVIFVDEKDSEVRGFIFASVEELDGRKVCFIQASVIDPKHRNTGFELIARLNRWALDKGLEGRDRMVMGFTADKKGRKRAFERKYKFREYSIFMARDVAVPEKRGDKDVKLLQEQKGEVGHDVPSAAGV